MQSVKRMQVISEVGTYAKEWLTMQEWRDLKNYPDLKWRDEVLLKTVYNSALRISEAVALRYPYDFEQDDDGNCYILIREEKTDDSSNIAARQPLNVSVYKDIKRYMEGRDDRLKDSSRIFVSYYAGEVSKISKRRCYDILNEYASALDIEKKLGNHSLRRSRALHLLESEKMDIYDVSSFLRHSDIRQTMEYLKLDKKRIAELAGEADLDYDL